MRVVTALALVLLAGTAQAAPTKTVCNLLVDPAGDAGSAYTGSFDSAPYDLVGGDVATKGDVLKVAWRLADGEAQPVAGSTHFDFFLQAAGGPRLWVHAEPDGLTPGYQLYQENLPPDIGFHYAATGTGTFDRGKRQLTVVVSTAATRQPLKDGVVISGLSAASVRWVGADDGAGHKTGTGDEIDSEETGTTYKAGARSCIS